MRIIINKATGVVLPAIGAEGATATELNPISVRGGSLIPVELQFVDGDPQAGIRYPVDTVIQWELKRVGEYTGDAVIPPIPFTRPSTDDGYYTASLDTSIADVLAALNNADVDVSNDLDSITLAGEITIQLPTADVPDRTQHLYLTVENFYSQGGITPLATHISSTGSWTNTGGTKREVTTVYFDDPDEVTVLSIYSGDGSGGATVLRFDGMTALTDLTVSGLATVTALDLRPCTALINVTAAALGLTSLNIADLLLVASINVSGNALSAAQVNAALIALDDSGVTAGTADFSGGTNAAPTGAGITAKTNLIGKFWTVTTT
jgi:hypothetical protein